MKKMSRRIFINMFFVSSVVMLLSTILTVGIVYKIYTKQNMISIENQLYATAHGVRLNGASFLESLQTEYRITLIDTDGAVLFDNRRSTKNMENHNGRKEVVQARKNGIGYSERYSDTISKKTINVALQLENGWVLRISENTSTIWNMLFTTLLSMAVVMVIGITIAVFLSFRVARVITKPINSINLNAPGETMIYEEIRPLAEKIEEQNDKIKKQMQKLNEEHQRQDHMRRDFTANVSHELKTPLTSISGFAEIIQNGIAKDEDIIRFAGKIHDESQRLIILVGDIIKLSQLDGKDIQVKMEPVDLYEASRAVMSHLESQAEKKYVSLKLQGSHLIVTGAEQIIEEMIFNLVDNGIKYNREGGQVVVKIEKTGEGIVLTVTDNGIGIPPGDIDRIFERFYRVDKSHSKNIGGTGLGLSIVKHGANFHNAKVSVQSKQNERTTFQITF